MMDGDKNGNYTVKSVKYNFLMNVILKISLFVFPLITFPYVSRVLGPSGNGKVSFATSIISYATMIASIGIPTYGIRACAQCRDDKQMLSKTVQELLMICFGGMILSYGVLLVLIQAVTKFHAEKTLILVMSSSLILSSIGMEWFYQGIEQYKYITIRNIAFKAIAVVLMFLLVHTSDDYVLYGAITVVGTVGSNILNIIKSREYISFKPFKHYEIKKHIVPALNFFLLTVASTIYSNLDTVMIGLMTTDSEVGFYNAGVKVRSMLLGFVNALSTVLLPRVSYYVKNKMYEDYNKIVNISINFILFISVPLTAFFIFEADDTIMLLAGSGYGQAILPMIIIMPTLIVAGLNNLTGIQILGSLGLEKFTVVSTSSAAILDLGLNAILIPQYGASGAAFSTLLAEILALFIQIYCIQHKAIEEVKMKFNLKNTIKIIVASIIGCVFCALFKRLGISSSHLFLLVLSTAIFAITAFLSLLCMKEEIMFSYGIPVVKKVLNKITSLWNGR